MSRTEPEAREKLVEAGLRLLEEQGPEALNARRLAAEIGASTMAVYTHFGGMAGVYEALGREAFARFERHLRLPDTDDPVADLLALGLAYREYALASPERYRLMFGLAPQGSLPSFGHDLTTEGTPTTVTEMNDAFALLPRLVRRAMDAGRIREDDPVLVAGQFWCMVHGYVLLETIGMFGQEGRGVLHILGPQAINLLVGLGDDRRAAERSAGLPPQDLGTAKAAAEEPAPRRGRRPRSTQ
ncbi:TetR/AcrR family transcriptional regulator [Actinomadura sp. KC345]|uniref:TetR/AcrR family transcriptional regulator n=1 Tax=Actinomadura sp. KC345 TaxID=2530371 RepID=UPI0010462519|nr:TetR/AcrR family transcriptional regulator [Actinomadura sp. KC345]TDC46677.1 TetR/AcrR family transcriptional regulator [Actinomadura sp. KC345]